VISTWPLIAAFRRETPFQGHPVFVMADHFHFLSFACLSSSSPSPSSAVICLPPPSFPSLLFSSSPCLIPPFPRLPAPSPFLSSPRLPIFLLLPTLISCPLQKFKVSSFGSIGTSESVPSAPVLSSPLQQLQVSFQGTGFTKIVFFQV
jgi:hypothetical protein